MIKDILVVLDDAGERAGPYAISLARAFAASVTGVAMSPDDPFQTVAVAEVAYVAVEERREAEARAIRVSHRFAKLAEPAGLDVETLRVCGIPGETEAQLIDIARLRDLAIVEQRDPDRAKRADRYIEQLLLKTGRPTLVVPYIHDTPALFDHVTVAWDGSAVAARALADAIPFLQHASHVEILSVQSENLPKDAVRDQRMVRHLARHGVDARARTLSSTLSVAETLLSALADSGSNLLVMGAYGHSRLREAVLGGASRDILRTMTVPVLMSH